MTREIPNIVTDRLLLRLARPDEAALIVRHYAENKEHFAPFQFRFPDEFYTVEHWQNKTREHIEAFEEDRAVNLFIFERGATRPDIVGTANFSNIVRRSAQFCNLGYGLSREYEGRGYMTEALRAAIAYIFDDLNLHRIMANYIPSNRRSQKVLLNLGFTVEGFARDYLFLDGRWQDHVMTSLTNAAWRTSE